jgi:putative Ca2+/H+ antiporter (TMEM165/GDT1 family)
MAKSCVNGERCVSEAFLAAFALVGVSEIGDKTQLAILTLSTRYGKPFRVLLGAVLAFFVADGVAVLVGGSLVQVVSPFYLKSCSAIIFLVFGILTLRGRDDGGMKVGRKSRLLLASFNIVVFAEIGDKTQIAAALLAAQFDAPLPVLLGSVTALAILSVIAVLAGTKLRHLVPLRALRLASGLAFIGFGVWSLLEAFVLL